MAEDNIKRIEPSKILKKTEDESEKGFFLSLRPKFFKDFVGQRQVVENLMISIEAAKKRMEPLDHILFYGPPGLGKTTLAYIIANEMGSAIVATSGPALERPADLMGLLTKLNKGDILFIDEVHRLPKIVEEFLYPAMEDFRIDFMLDKGPHARSVRFYLNHFTLIGATTRAGLLTRALRDRFGIFHHLDFYEQRDLEILLKRSGRILNIQLDDGGCSEIAKRARGTPRIANRILKRVRDYAQVKGKGIIDREIAMQALNLLAIDSIGLDRLDRHFLLTIIEQYNGGPVGINALAATLQQEEDTLIDMVEPFLLKIGFLARSQRGRFACPPAYKHLGIENKKPQLELFTDSGEEDNLDNQDNS